MAIREGSSADERRHYRMCGCFGEHLGALVVRGEALLREGGSDAGINLVAER